MKTIFLLLLVVILALYPVNSACIDCDLSESVCGKFFDRTVQLEEAKCFLMNATSDTAVDTFMSSRFNYEHPDGPMYHCPRSSEKHQSFLHMACMMELSDQFTCVDALVEPPCRQWCVDAHDACFLFGEEFCSEFPTTGCVSGASTTAVSIFIFAFISFSLLLIL